MTPPFGAVPVGLRLPDEPRSASADTVRVAALLEGLAAGDAVLEVAPALPTAAFSRRDTLLPGYAEAAEAMGRHGFEPMVRRVGGHLAAYGPGSLVLHLAVPHPEPRAQITERFARFGSAVADALSGLGVDARVGPVPGEYCDGKFSVNAGGRVKLVGTGQRIVRAGFLFSAVVMVHSPDPARAALVEAYRALDLELRPSSVGAVADSVPGTSVAEVRDVLVRAVRPLLGQGEEASPASRSAASTTSAMAW